LRRPAQVLLLLFVVNTFVLPQLAGTRDAISLIGELNPLLLIAGLAAEIASLACIAHLMRTILPESVRPSIWTMQRIVLSARAASRVVPGGAAAAGTLSYRLLRRSGVPTSEAGFSVGAQSLESAAVLVVLLFLALLVSVPVSGFNAAYIGSSIVGLVLLTAIGLLVLSVTRGQEGVIDVARRLTTRVRFLDADSLEGSLRVLASQLSELASDRAELARHAAWSAAYWLLDATALWVFIAAYGHWTRVDGLIVAFALANIVATIPITPGGLGVMELTLAASLAGFGVPPATALLGVASWRIVNFWLPIPIGAASYLSLQLGSPDLTTEENLEGFTDEARRSAGETTPWRWRSR
jgi:uncharacterized protein (TIRG00374 family)